MQTIWIHTWVEFGAFRVALLPEDARPESTSAWMDPDCQAMVWLWE